VRERGDFPEVFHLLSRVLTLSLAEASSFFTPLFRIVLGSTPLLRIVLGIEDGKSNE
jgi:hypothetical protein